MKTENIHPIRIKIECICGDYDSYFMDINGLLHGEWGGFKEVNEKGPNGETLYKLYYSQFNHYIPINEYGFFYNKFSCKKYDGIIKLPNVNIYICEKNGRFGLIDEDEKTILHTVFNKISPFVWGLDPGYGIRQLYMFLDNFQDLWKNEYKEKIFFIVTTETGKFLYNLSKEKESSLYDDIFFSSYEEYPQIIYKRGGKYGALDILGNVILKPYYDMFLETRRTLFFKFHDKLYRVWVENGLYYRKISSLQYDVCFMVQVKSDRFFYIVKNGNKYGLISYKNEIVSAPILDDILLYNNHMNVHYEGCLQKQFLRKHSNLQEISLVIAKKGDKYKLFNLYNRNLVLDNCDSIKYIYDDSSDRIKKDTIEFTKDCIKGYVLYNERIVSTENYEDVEYVKGYIKVRNEGKFGLFCLSGKEMFPCIYDNIQIPYVYKFVLTKEEKEETVIIKNSLIHNSTYESTTYGRYAGSYVQDEMGWSDDDIDTVLDGDSSAYWNID